jgi:hypothetical protein
MRSAPTSARQKFRVVEEKWPEVVIQKFSLKYSRMVFLQLRPRSFLRSSNQWLRDG